jgi:hypothetical protein
VRADNGVVNVTYLPQDARLAQAIPEVCKGLPGARDIRVTMAMTNLLWIQEEFQPHSELYDEVVELATKWNAAVELIRPAPEQESPAPQQGALEPRGAEAARLATREHDGWIEEDVAEEEAPNGGLKQTLDELARIGRSGGGRVVYGDPNQLVDTLDRNVPYTLVVLGDLFLSKGHAARLRATRDLRSFLSDRIRAPVVTADELGGQYFFGKRDMARAASLLLLTIVLYWLVFTYQEPILTRAPGWYAVAIEDLPLQVRGCPSCRVLAVFLAPLVAYSYGTVARAALKLIKME